MNIQVFDNINTSHAATGFDKRTDLDAFHIFTLESTYPSTRKVMPPYRFNWYQVVCFENSDDATLNINAESVENLSNYVLFASPEHVMAWVRGEAQRGYILYFRQAFLAQYPRMVIDEFPYFRLNEINHIEISNQHRTVIHNRFADLLEAFHSQHLYRVELLQSLLLALLFECKQLYDLQEHSLQETTSPQQALIFRFQQFVNQHFLTRKKVSEYADLLGVTPDYLAQVAKHTTGRTPLVMIAERVMLEAKKLLRYTDLNISEIAAYMGYEEPTHFTRFFRKNAGMSPSSWRQSPQ